MSHTSQFRALALLAAFTITTAAHAAPPADQVLAEVHAASRIAVGLLDRIPEQGSVEQEAAYTGVIGATGLGEIMGWGQDRFDNVDPEITAVITLEFTRAFRVLEQLPEDGSGITYEQVKQLARKVGDHIDAIRQAVDSEPTPARTRLELHNSALFLAHHANEFAGSPIAPGNRLQAVIGLRNLAVAVEVLDEDLAEFPELAQQVAPAMDALRELSTSPPSCTQEPTPSDGCVEDLAQEMASRLEFIRDKTAPAAPGESD